MSAKKIRLTAGMFSMLAIFSNNPASAWMTPVASGYTITNGFWECNVQCYHLGDDIVAPEGTNVRSIGAGLVVEVAVRTGRSNYGGRVLIQYETPDGPIVALYGHLGSDTDDPATDDIFVAVGDRVTEGQVIGRTGSRSENGGWPPHLHLGIHRGAYTGGATECGRWTYAGYTAEAYEPSDPCYCAVMDNWYAPSEFLGVRPRDLRLTHQEISPQSGTRLETAFTWRASADGGRGAPITASVIIQNDATSAQYPAIMNYVAGTSSPFQFVHTYTFHNAGSYSYRIRLQTCFDDVRGDRASGPAVYAPPPPCVSTVEICDGIDNDCDGLVDDSVTRSCTNACGNIGTQTCSSGVFGSCSAPACPPACVPTTEICDNRDNDCDGLVDDSVTRSCTNACGNIGTQTCNSGGFGSCSAAACPPPCVPTAETCDNADNDCDGLVDDSVTRSCTNECGNTGTQTCNSGGFGSCSASACPPACVPTAETCDNRDNDCDFQIDEELVMDCANGCGGIGTQWCVSGAFTPCDAADCPPTGGGSGGSGSGNSNPPLSAPEIISPGGGTLIAQFPVGASGYVNLIWNAVPGASSYEYIVRYGGFGESGSIATQTITSSTLTGFTPSHSNYGVGFTFKVRALGSDGTPGPWSVIRSFFVSYTLGSIVRCTGSACPSPDAWYEISSDIYDLGITGVPPLLILDWISSSCTAGRTARSVTFDDISGYQRSARFGGCP